MSFLRRIFRDKPDGAGYAARSGEEDIVCLAFSRKYGGRCVAGINLRDGRWIRPVSSTPEGTLMPQHYRLARGDEPRVLDALRVGLDRAQPEKHQPENWILSPREWQLLARPVDLTAWRLVEEAVSDEPLLFGRPGDRIAIKELQDHPAPSSLTLVAPSRPCFISKLTYSNQPQARVRFFHGEHLYDLAVTDPQWGLEISGRRDGEYEPQALGLDPRRMLLTISLGEPFGGYCYKLVAAIFERPPP